MFTNSRLLLRVQSRAARRLPTAASTSRYSLGLRSHTTDSYGKDVDSSPAADSKIHRVDPSSENVQKPHEPPSGQWSATGVEAGVKNAQGKKNSDTEGERKTGMKEYGTMSSDKPYGAPGAGQRYGGKEGYATEKGGNAGETSQSTEGQGPAGSESGGRKPEGR
ncbi:hypothetical protein B0H16DRAFT_1894065 [Mycena metata]|uniref:Uncharacterized protein n=1 Tax=Mycena metata TaxID=1033252 RepID=A0AAD7HW44_9AGAR|nr:hypothetical protein B0H16DRAFT_1894065 [Mycena metata]